jgi:hypothetical protein
VRKACVRRSIASATTAGDGGNGTFDAKASADARGVRVNAVRARVFACSISESSLEGISIVMIEVTRSLVALLTLAEIPRQLLSLCV